MLLGLVLPIVGDGKAVAYVSGQLRLPRTGDVGGGARHPRSLRGRRQGPRRRAEPHPAHEAAAPPPPGGGGHTTPAPRAPEAGGLAIGALVRHKPCERSELLGGRWGTLGAAAPLISDPIIRNL